MQCLGCSTVACPALSYNVVLTVYNRARNLVVRDKLNTFVHCPLVGLDLSGIDLQNAASGSAVPHTDFPRAEVPSARSESIYDCYAVINHYGQVCSNYALATVGQCACASSSCIVCFSHDLIRALDDFKAAMFLAHMQMFGGHYTAFVNHEISQSAYSMPPEGGQWFEMDDSTVTPIKSSDVVTDAAYVLFYRRRGTAMDSSVFPADPVPSL